MAAFEEAIGRKGDDIRIAALVNLTPNIFRLQVCGKVIFPLTTSQRGLSILSDGPD